MSQPPSIDAAANSPRAVPSKRGERLFYLGMSIALLLTVFAGFAPTYYLKAHYGNRPLTPLVHAHGLIFSAWIILFLIQTSLVTARRTDIHRRLGVAGGVLAALMLVFGTWAAIRSAALGHSPPGAPPPLIFLVIPLGEMVSFPVLVGAGLYFRRRVDIHKRLMLIATIAIMSAAVARLPLEILKSGPPAFFGLTDLFLVAVVIYDFVSRGRIHAATLCGSLFVIATQAFRLWLGGTEVWMKFATWVTQ